MKQVNSVQPKAGVLLSEKSIKKNKYNNSLRKKYY